MTIGQRLQSIVPLDLFKIMMNYSETPEYLPTTDRLYASKERDPDNYLYHTLVREMAILCEYHYLATPSHYVISHFIDHHRYFIKKYITAKQYDVSTYSSILKTASRKIVEPFLDDLLKKVDLRSQLSAKLLDPLPTLALWGFHRYALTSLDNFDRKFHNKLVPLIEAALKERGIDLNSQTDKDCKDNLLKVLEKEYDESELKLKKSRTEKSPLNTN